MHACNGQSQTSCHGAIWGHTCTQCTATLNRLGFSTVSASTEALVTTTQEQSKRGTCKRAKWPDRKLSKKIDTQKMSKGSAMSTEHNLCDSTSCCWQCNCSVSEWQQCATKDCDASSFLRPIRSKRTFSRDAFSLLKYMPWKGNLCKSKVAWAVTSRTRSSSNLAAAVAIEVPTIPNGTCLGCTQTWLVDKGVGRHLHWYCVWLPQTCCNLTLQLHPQFLCGAALRMPKPEAL